MGVAGRVRVAAVVVAVVATVTMPMAAAAGPDDRVAGDTRVATSVAIAQRSFPTGTGVVYLARADVFADSLAAGTLTDGPILFVGRNGVEDVVHTEIARLDPEVVVALGGELAVPDDVLTSAADGRVTDRVAGEDRVTTAVAISARGFPDGAPEVYLTYPQDSPDAVVAGALTRGPVLFVPRDGPVPPAVADEIARLDPTTVVALGGTVAMPEATLDAAADGRPTNRLSGEDRIATAVAVAAHGFPMAPPTVYLARSDLFADAVAAGSLADGPVLLVPSCGELPAAVAAEVARLAPGDVKALGGPVAVCDDLLDAARAAAGVDGDDVDDRVLIAPTAQVVTEDEAAGLQEVTDGTLVFRDDAGRRFVAGDVLAVPPTPHAPGGLLRRVERATRQADGSVTLVTSDAVLTDAVVQGAVDEVRELSFDDAAVVTQNGVATADQRRVGFDQTFGFEEGFGQRLVFVDQDGNLGTREDQIAVEGRLDFGASFNFAVDIGRGEGITIRPELKRFRAVAEAFAELTVDVHAGRSVSVVGGTLDLAEVTFPTVRFSIGGFPVYIEPVLDVDIQLEGSLAARVTWTATQSATASLGVEFDRDGGWQPVNTFEEDASSDATFEASATARAALPVELEARIYSIGGPTVGLVPYVEATATFPLREGERPWVVQAGLDWTVGAEARFAVPVLGDFELEYEESFTLFGPYVIAQAPPYRPSFDPDDQPYPPGILQVYAYVDENRNGSEDDGFGHSPHELDFTIRHDDEGILHEGGVDDLGLYVDTFPPSTLEIVVDTSSLPDGWSLAGSATREVTVRSDELTEVRLGVRPPVPPNEVMLITRTATGDASNGDVLDFDMSPNGARVIFSSDATDLAGHVGPPAGWGTAPWVSGWFLSSNTLFQEAYPTPDSPVEESVAWLDVQDDGRRRAHLDGQFFEAKGGAQDFEREYCALDGELFGPVDAGEYFIHSGNISIADTDCDTLTVVRSHHEYTFGAPLDGMSVVTGHQGRENTWFHFAGTDPDGGGNEAVRHGVASRLTGLVWESWSADAPVAGQTAEVASIGVSRSQSHVALVELRWVSDGGGLALAPVRHVCEVATRDCWVVGPLTPNPDDEGRSISLSATGNYVAFDTSDPAFPGRADGTALLEVFRGVPDQWRDGATGGLTQFSTGGTGGRVILAPNGQDAVWAEGAEAPHGQLYAFARPAYEPELVSVCELPPYDEDEDAIIWQGPPLDDDSRRSTLPVLQFDAARLPHITEGIEDAFAEGFLTTMTRETDRRVIRRNRREACKGPFAGGPGPSPDEYPFASSQQGGAFNDVHVWGVPLSEQHSQGGTISSFYRREALTSGQGFTVEIVDTSED